MKYATYSEYKASGVEWLDVIPSHWTVKAARFGYSIQLGKMLQPESSSSLDVETPYLKSQHVQWESVRVDDPPLMWASPSELVKYGIQDGDLLVCEGGDVGRAGIVKEMPKRTIIQNALHRVRPRFRHDIRFLMYVLEHASGQSWFDIICNRSTIAHFTGEKFGALRVPAPPLDEQQTIARFLDAKTAQIDALVAQKRQLIDKLKEKRQALIARTVTRGLPPEAAKAAGLEPNPEMKDSGVEWLGTVPARWKIKAIKWATPVQRGASPRPIDDPSYFDDDGEYAWVRISDVTAAGMYLDATEQRLSDLGSSLSVKMKPGSLFLSIAGTVGKPCIANIKCCIHDGFVYFPRWKGDSRFLFYVFASGEPYKGLGKMGTQLNLNTDTVGSIVIGIPDAEEQKLIADYLDKTTAELDSMTTAVEAAIDRLTEYRQALITSAVTGKIDVRGVV